MAKRINIWRPSLRQPNTEDDFIVLGASPESQQGSAQYHTIRLPVTFVDESDDEAAISAAFSAALAVVPKATVNIVFFRRAFAGIPTAISQDSLAAYKLLSMGTRRFFSLNPPRRGLTRLVTEFLVFLWSSSNPSLISDGGMRAVCLEISKRGQLSFIQLLARRLWQLVPWRLRLFFGSEVIIPGNDTGGWGTPNEDQSESGELVEGEDRREVGFGVPIGFSSEISVPSHLTVEPPADAPGLPFHSLAPPQISVEIDVQKQNPTRVASWKFLPRPNLPPASLKEEQLLHPTHPLSMEFFLDPLFEKSFQETQAASLLESPYLHNFAILSFLSIFSSLENGGVFRPFSPVRMAITDPIIILAIAAQIQLTFQVLVFRQNAFLRLYYQPFALALGMITTATAVVWIFFGRDVVSFYLMPVQKGWGTVAIMVVVAAGVSCGFLHSLICGILFLCLFAVFHFTDKSVMVTGYPQPGQFILSVFVVLFVLVGSYVSEMRARLEFIGRRCLQSALSNGQRLLRNILPEKIIKGLTAASRGMDPQGFASIAEDYEQVTVLFADIENFTEMTSEVVALEVVRFLGALFGEFDRVMQRHGLEKIKTIGDAYMAVAGLPEPAPDHAVRAARAALELVTITQRGRFRFLEGDKMSEIDHQSSPETFLGSRAVPIALRVGLHSGPCAGGVIGRNKFLFDIWGDTVNTAARMESLGVRNQVHCSEATMAKLGSLFNFVQRGSLAVKGKGRMNTFLLGEERGGLEGVGVVGGAGGLVGVGGVGGVGGGLVEGGGLNLTQSGPADLVSERIVGFANAGGAGVAGVGSFVRHTDPILNSPTGCLEEISVHVCTPESVSEESSSHPAKGA